MKQQSMGRVKWAVTIGAALVQLACADLDQQTPAIVSVTPSPDAIDVGADAAIVVVLDEEVAPTSVDSASLQVSRGSRVVAGALTVEGTTIRFAPSERLAAAEVYQVRIDGVTDLAGNPIVSPYAWSFRTAGAWGPTLSRPETPFGCSVTEPVVESEQALTLVGSNTIPCAMRHDGTRWESPILWGAGEGIRARATDPGDVLAAFGELGDATDIVHFVRHPADGAWGEVVSTAQPMGIGTAWDVGSGGHAVAVWLTPEDETSMLASARRLEPGATEWSPEELLALPRWDGDRHSVPSVDVGRGGELVLAYVTTDQMNVVTYEPGGWDAPFAVAIPTGPAEAGELVEVAELHVAAGEDGSAIVAWRLAVGGTLASTIDHREEAIYAMERDAAGGFGAPERVDAPSRWTHRAGLAPDASYFTLQIDAEGTAWMTWIEAGGDTRSRTVIASKARSASWQLEALCDPDLANCANVGLAIDAGGNAHAVWSDLGEVLTARRPRGATTFGVPTMLGSFMGAFPSLRVAVDGDGHAAITWMDEVAGERWVARFQ